MSKTLTEQQMIHRLKEVGIKIPEHLAKMAPKLEKSGISLSLAASMLLQESGGGENVWGHDDTIFIGGVDAKTGKNWGSEVTDEAYAAYKLERDATHKVQGVGPLQLTWIGFQQAADEKGGCWKPVINLEVGFDTLAGLIKSNKSVHDGVMHYNGSGPAAEKYAAQVMARAQQLEKTLG